MIGAAFIMRQKEYQKAKGFPCRKKIHTHKK